MLGHGAAVPHFLPGVRGFFLNRRCLMTFQIGDTAIHLSHGLGEVVDIEDRIIHDRPTTCYVFQTPDLTIWIPIDDAQQHTLRAPTPPAEFNKLSQILTTPSAPLPDDRLLRKAQLTEQIRGGQLPDICTVVRSLTDYMQSARLNDQEKSIFERAMRSLVTEWAYSLDISLALAQQAVDKLLSSAETSSEAALD